MKKTLQNAALLAEIVGAVAVVISLVYVGFSVSQNTRALMVSSHQSLVGMEQEKNSWFRDQQFAEIYEIANDDIGRLSSVQTRQYRSFESDAFNAWEFAFITHSDGMMDDDIWAGWDGYYRQRLQRKGPQWFWRNTKGDYSSAFRAHVDSALQDVDR